ncbi:hypothetical protein [Xanthobacter autotrophicus]|uniref:hypothetical protein n=1 Tax=Xanthobacter autotrophicus TaxID=280 RepID=UPI003727843E
MRLLIYPLSFLRLRSEDGHFVAVKEIWVVTIVCLIIAIPFVVFGANFFGDKGFFDRFGSFSAVLTGFYIAALVGIASFSNISRDLDKIITVGKIISKSEGRDLWLTRRQYVCSMFGYLAFISMFLSVVAMIVLIVASSVKLSVPDLRYVQWGVLVIRSVFIFSFCFAVSHMLIVTLHGLFYLIERLYAEAPRLPPKSLMSKDDAD